MSSRISLLLLNNGDPDAVADSIRSLAHLVDFDTELLVVEQDSDGLHWHRNLSEAIANSGGGYIQIMTAGAKLEPERLYMRLERLRQSEGASCLLRCSRQLPPLSKHDCMSGPSYLFTCLEQVIAPASSPDQLLMKRTRRLPILDVRLTALLFTDLTFQLAREGDILLDCGDDVAPVPPAECIEEWMTLGEKYDSFLRCTGASAELLMERLIRSLITPDKLQSGSLSEGDPGRNSRAEELLLESGAISFQGTSWQRLLQTVVSLMDKGGAVTPRPLCQTRMITNSAIRRSERELIGLLESRSWRYTRVLREVRRVLIDDRDDTMEGASIQQDYSINYANYLKKQIRKIYSSRSWRLSRPFRSSESLKSRPALSDSAVRVEPEII